MKKQDSKKWLQGWLLAGLVLGASSWVWAAPDTPPEGMMPGSPEEAHEGMEMDGPPRFKLEGLNLTAQQMELLKQDRSAKHKKMIQIRAEMEILRVDLRDAADQEKADMTKVEAIASKIGDNQAKMIVEKVKGVIYLRSILTPEQRKLFEQRMMETPVFEHGRAGRKSMPGNEKCKPGEKNK